MIVLSYGFKQPENGDRGSIWFPALNDNIQRLNDHNHDGSNSAPLAANSIQSAFVTALAANWVNVNLGTYSQDMACPAGFNMDNYTITARLASTGAVILPTIQRLTATTFRIFTIYNTLNITVTFR